MPIENRDDHEAQDFLLAITNANCDASEAQDFGDTFIVAQDPIGVIDDQEPQGTTAISDEFEDFDFNIFLFVL